MRGMGVVAVGLMLASVSGAAMAQSVAPDFGAMARMRQGKSYSDLKAGAFLQQFSKKGQAWIAAETQRQIDTPRPLLDVAMEADKVLEDDAKDLKQRYRVHPLDVTRAVSMVIMTDARDAAAAALKAAQEAGNATAIAAAQARLTTAEANLEAARRVESDASKALLQL